MKPSELLDCAELDRLYSLLDPREGKMTTQAERAGALYQFAVSFLGLVPESDETFLFSYASREKHPLLDAIATAIEDASKEDTTWGADYSAVRLFPDGSGIYICPDGGLYQKDGSEWQQADVLKGII